MSVQADMEAVARVARRAELERLVGMSARVAIVNPYYPEDRPWKGSIAALMDEPSILLDGDDGKRRALPQSFEVIEITELPPVRDDADLEASLISALERASGGVCEHCVSSVFTRQVEEVMAVLRQYGKVLDD